MAALLEGRHHIDAGSDHPRAKVKSCIACEHDKPLSEKKRRATKAKGPAPQSPSPPAPKRPSKRKKKPPEPKPTERSSNPDEGSRHCRGCGALKPIELFHRKGTGRASRCNVCERRRKREEWAADIEASRAKRRARYWQNVASERARNSSRMRLEHNRAANRLAVLEYQHRNPEKTAAWRAVKLAVRAGLLKPTAECQALGCDRTADHKHHLSYHPARHTDIIALCRLHHEAVHHLGPVRLKPTASHEFAVSPRDQAPTSNKSKQEGSPT